ncbi:MAG: hypothetical protein GY696_40735, partial [Gammaproteobacteria bacterium]|nr:hypothetical protein [Gammaproteobacteria bacterium]
NAGSSFSRMIVAVLGSLGCKRIVSYVDDICIWAENGEDHEYYLRYVLTRLRKFNLRVKLKKCQFAFNQVTFLGHRISSKGLEMDPEKVKAVVECPRPKNVTDIRHFMGLLTFYRRYIFGFGDMNENINQLLRKDEPFLWTENQENDFLRLKEAVTHAPVLAFPNPEEPYHLSCDASDTAVGAVLEQYNEAGEKHPVAFASRTLTKSERNYTISER